MQTLKDTKHPKDKTFDKIYAMMLENCVENIEERTALKILDPDNFQVWENKYTAREKELLDVVHKAKLNDDLTANVYEGATGQAYYKYEEYSYYLIGTVLGFLT